MLCAMTAFVLSGCGAVVTTSLTVKDDGSGSRVMTATFTNDDSDEAKKVFAVGSGVLEGSIKRHIPSQLAFKGLKISGKTMTATFELDFSNHDDYMAKVRALTAGSSKEVHSDVQKIDTPLVQGAVGDEDFDSSDLLAWLADGLAQDGLIDKDNTNSVFDNDGNVEFSIGGQRLNSPSPLKVEQVVDNGFDDVVLKLDVKSTESIGATIWYFSTQALGSDKQAKVNQFLQQATKDGNGKVSDATVGELPEKLRDGRTDDAFVKKVAIDPTNLKTLNKRIAQALGNPSSDIRLQTGKVDLVDPEQEPGHAWFGVPVKLTGRPTCAAICARKKDDNDLGSFSSSNDNRSPSDTSIDTFVEYPASWSDSSESNSYDADSSAQHMAFSDGSSGLTAQMTMPAEIKGSAVTATIDPEGEVSYQAQWDFDKATVAAYKDSLKSFLGEELSGWKAEEKTDDKVLHLTYTAKADSVEAFNRKFSKQENGAVRVGVVQTDESTFKRQWRIEATALSLVPDNATSKVVLSHGKFVDGDKEATWDLRHAQDGEFKAIASTWRTTPLIIWGVVVLIVVGGIIWAIGKRATIKRWFNRPTQASRVAADQQRYMNRQYAPDQQGYPNQLGYPGQPGYLNHPGQPTPRSGQGWQNQAPMPPNSPHGQSWNGPQNGSDMS